jgi:hypothetical protein
MSRKDETVEEAMEAIWEEAQVISDLISRDSEAGVRAADEWIRKMSRILPADHDGIVNARAAIAAAVANPNTKKEYAESLKQLLEVMNKELM